MLPDLPLPEAGNFSLEAGSQVAGTRRAEQCWKKCWGAVLVASKSETTNLGSLLQEPCTTRSLRCPEAGAHLRLGAREISQEERSRSSDPAGCGLCGTKPLGFAWQRVIMHVPHYRCLVSHGVSGFSGAGEGEELSAIVLDPRRLEGKGFRTPPQGGRRSGRQEVAMMAQRSCCHVA